MMRHEQGNGEGASKRPRWGIRLAWLVALLLVAAVTAGPLIRALWVWRTDNPVRGGLLLARRLGCFQCHGELGTGGIPDPGLNDDVPAWERGIGRVDEREAEIRLTILDGSGEPRAALTRTPAIRMPAYRGLVGESEVDKLTAAFVVLSGIRTPPPGSRARQGLELAARWRCFSCHGPGGSGGLPNPGSYTGFVPGWYGPGFAELVRSREEFDSWVREGRIVRVTDKLVGRYFLRRQRLQMPRYSALTAEELDALWAYVGWLGETNGGIDS